MTLPRLAALTEYWRSNPPLHQLIAAYIGYKPVAAGGVKDTVKGISDFVADSGLVAITGAKT